MPMRHALPHLFSSQIALTFWRWSSFKFYSIHSIEWDACMVLRRTAPSIRSIWSQSTPCAGQTVYSHFVEFECSSTHALAPLLFNSIDFLLLLSHQICYFKFRLFAWIAVQPYWQPRIQSSRHNFSFTVCFFFVLSLRADWAVSNHKRTHWLLLYAKWINHGINCFALSAAAFVFSSYIFWFEIVRTETTTIVTLL